MEYTLEEIKEACYPGVKQRMAKRVVGMLNHDPLIVDFETTGLGKTARAVEIGIIDTHGQVLFDRRVKPKIKISIKAEEIHGISNEEVADMDGVQAYADELTDILDGRSLIAFNKPFDRMIMDNLIKDAKIMAVFGWEPCAMYTFAEWNRIEKDTPFGWELCSLERALAITGGKYEGRAHGAITDCKATLHVLKAMADSFNPDAPKLPPYDRTENIELRKEAWAAYWRMINSKLESEQRTAQADAIEATQESQSKRSKWSWLFEPIFKIRK